MGFLSWTEDPTSLIVQLSRYGNLSALAEHCLLLFSHPARSPYPCLVKSRFLNTRLDNHAQPRLVPKHIVKGAWCCWVGDDELVAGLVEMSVRMIHFPPMPCLPGCASLPHTPAPHPGMLRYYPAASRAGFRFPLPDTCRRQDGRTCR